MAPKFRVMIPTRDSALWVGVFLRFYRELGIEPLYVADARSKDGTPDLLREMGADLVLFTPSGDFPEDGMVEFGSRCAGAKWIMRIDDDEFPSRSLLDWANEAGADSLDEAWFISRRELFSNDGEIFYSRAQARYHHPCNPAFLQPCPRLHHVDRVRYIRQVHTPGIESPRRYSFAPESGFLIHCNCLLRSPAERLEKIRRYEEIEPGSTWKIGDEYLPELFDLSHHAASRDGLEEFRGLLSELPTPLERPLSMTDAERDLMYREVEEFGAQLRSRRASEEDLKWLARIPRRLLKPIATVLCILGFKGVGTMIWNYELCVHRPR